MTTYQCPECGRRETVLTGVTDVQHPCPKRASLPRPRRFTRFVPITLNTEVPA